MSNKSKIKQEILRRLKKEMKDAGPVVGSYAIPSFQKKRKHKDTDNLGKKNKNGNSGQPDLEEATKPDFNSKGYKEADKLVSKLRSSLFRKLNDDEIEQFRAKIAREFDLNEGTFTRHSQVQGYHPQGGLNQHVLNKSKKRNHDDDANFKKKDSGQDDVDEARLNEIGIFDVNIFLKNMIPPSMRNTVNRQNKEKYESVVGDLVDTLNRFWKKHSINYRVRKK